MSRARPSRLRIASSVIALALGATGCRKDDRDPATTVLAFLDDLRRVDEDVERARRVLAALPSAARRDLEERAKRASVVLGRRMDPPELLADAFVLVRFEPVRTKSEVNGEHAVVELFGANEATEHGRIGCVREGDAWHVEVPFSAAATPREAADRAKP